MISLVEIGKYQLFAILMLSVISGLLIIFSMEFFSYSNLYLLRYIVFFILSVLIIRNVQKKHKFYLPSFYLFFFFCAVPLFGIPGYLFAYKKIFPDYLGVELDMWRALDLWLQGLFFVMAGIFIVHFIKHHFIKSKGDKKSIEIYSSWNWKRFDAMLLVLIGISSAFTILVTAKLGNIPILTGDIDRTRFLFADQVGPWAFRLARLWILVYLFGLIKLLKKIKIESGLNIGKNIPMIVLIFCSLLLEGIYGDRFHQFIMVVFSILMINKVFGKIKNRYILIFCIIGILAGNIVSIARNKSYRDMDASFPEKILLHTFGEFNVFAYTVQEYDKKNEFLGKDAFITAVADSIPKQVWAVFNIDKEMMRSDKSPAAVLAKIYRHYYGMRAGIIGEGFIAFGYLGLIFLSLIAGILFGVLENLFIPLRAFEVKEFVVAFILSVLMFLPLSQIDALTGTIAYYIYIMLICILVIHKKVISRMQLRQ